MTEEEKKKEMEQEISDWIETHGDPEGNLKDDDGGAEKEKEVIDVEAEEGKKRKQMWDHFTKIFEEALVCTQDWLRRATPINVKENTEELANLQEELIQEFKDMAIVDAHATKSQIQGSKKGWLHPPTSAHSQARPPRQARPQRRARTSLKINDHGPEAGVS